MKYLNEKGGKYSGMTMTGKAHYPRLIRPDTKFNSLGVYQADIRVPAEEAKDLMQELATVYKEWTGKAPNKADNFMWKEDLDEDGNSTGDILFKLRVKNFERDGQVVQRRPKIFFRNEDDKTENIGGGSSMKVQFQVYCWTASQKGVSLQPLSVLIEEVVEYESAGGNPFGVGSEASFEIPKQVRETDADTTQEEANDFF